MTRPRPVLVFGPTAVGKTDLILSLFSGQAEVVSADSMQVYRGMDIGTAKPGPDILEKLPHHLIDVRNPDEQFTAGDFVKAADRLVPDIAGRGLIPLISGGTAFYFKNYLFGLPESPPGNRGIRLALEAERAGLGLAALYEELKKRDPLSASRINPQDSYRILRALEVVRASGRPLSSYAVPLCPRSDIEPLIIGLFRDRAGLVKRIEARVERMFASGLEEEAERLISLGYTRSDPGMQGIGYREFFLAPRPPRESLKERIIIASRQYAKRQMTFFKSLPGVHWLHAEDEEGVRSLVDTFLKGCVTR